MRATAEELMKLLSLKQPDDIPVRVYFWKPGSVWVIETGIQPGVPDDPGDTIKERYEDKNLLVALNKAVLKRK